MKIAVAMFIALAATLGDVAIGASVPAAPTNWVTDQSGFLSPDTRSRLDARLSDYERATGHQVIVWVGTTIGDEPLEDWTERAFAAWRIGRKGLDDGVVLFVFPQDRKLRIEVGYGLEGQIPDVVAARIIRDTIVPAIKAGDHDRAITAGIDQLLAAIAAPSQSGASRAPGRISPGSVAAILLLIAIIALLTILGLAYVALTSARAATLFAYDPHHYRRPGGRSSGGWPFWSWLGSVGSGFSNSGGSFGSGFGGGFSGGGGMGGGGGASGGW